VAPAVGEVREGRPAAPAEAVWPARRRRGQAEKRQTVQQARQVEPQEQGRAWAEKADGRGVPRRRERVRR